MARYFDSITAGQFPYVLWKLYQTLKQHLPISGQEEVHELKKIAMSFEEKTRCIRNGKRNGYSTVAGKISIHLRRF
uniref:Mediator complex subunit 15 KIX domain-containing protein n=1 Tax=Solanum lycopersicum TaxID=4081 RepID=A0A3Q7EEP4_SOLLC